MRTVELAAVVLVTIALAACASPAPGGTAIPTGGGSPAVTATAGSPSPAATVAKTGSAKIGVGAPDAGFLPLAVAVDRLNAMGYEFELVEFESPETQTQALAAGDIDVGSAGPATVFAAAEQGLDLKIFLGYQNNPFALVTKQSLGTCESLEGQRVGVHSLESTTYALLLSYIEEECPETEPNILVVPGSENRLNGLLQDQLDAAPVDLQSVVQIFDARPDDFAVVGSFSELPVIGGVFYATPEWLSENEPLVLDFISVYLQTVEDAYADPDILAEKGETYLPAVEPELLPEVVAAWLDANVFDPTGGLTDDQLQFTFDFFAELTPYANLAGPEDVTDRSYLDKAPAGS